ncbi:MAG: DUF418 domain-containing protein [Flavisolibacter sp.]
MQTSSHTKLRLQNVDILRGIALLGILLVHFVVWHTAGPLPPGLGNATNVLNQVSSFFTNYLLSGKFFAFFSFLFGLSFYLQLKSLQKKGNSYYGIYSWRLLILLVIGMIHHLFWMGDILSLYAVLGFLLLFIHKWSSKLLITGGLLLASNLPIKFIIVAIHFAGSNGNTAETLNPDANRYFNAIDGGSLFDLFAFNWSMFGEKAEFLYASGRLFMTFGYFMIGMYAGRQKWFENLTSRSLFQKIFRWSGILIVVSILAGIFFYFLSQKFDLKPGDYPAFNFGLGILYDLMNVILVSFYISALSLLLFKETWIRLLSPFAAIGKMALTNYLLQTVSGLLLFYHIGLGWFPESEPYQNILLALVVFSLQVIFSIAWLRYFNFGPVEWIWRSLMYMKAQPMIKKRERQSKPRAVANGINS